MVMKNLHYLTTKLISHEKIQHDNLKRREKTNCFIEYLFTFWTISATVCCA